MNPKGSHGAGRRRKSGPAHVYKKKVDQEHGKAGDEKRMGHERVVFCVHLCNGGTESLTKQAQDCCWWITRKSFRRY